MIHLSYTSRATETITPALMISLLESARRHNPPLGITGLLYSAQGQFAQCLEGPKDAVEAIYAKIAADPRHTDLRAQRRALSARLFNDWSMAFVDTSSVEVARILTRHDSNSYEAQQWRAEDVLPILSALGQGVRAERIAIAY